MKQPNETDPKKLTIDGGLALIAVVTGVLMIPMFSLLPLLGIAAGVVTAVHITDNIRLK